MNTNIRWWKLWHCIHINLKNTRCGRSCRWLIKKSIPCCDYIFLECRAGEFKRVLDYNVERSYLFCSLHHSANRIIIIIIFLIFLHLNTKFTYSHSLMKLCVCRILHRNGKYKNNKLTADCLMVTKLQFKAFTIAITLIILWALVVFVV